MDELNTSDNSNTPRKLTDKAIYDQQLIHRALNQKDERAYKELMLRYYDSLYFTLVKIVKSKEDAEDLVSYTFEKAFMRLAQYSGEFAFSTWLFKIASNASIDFLRKKKNEGISFQIEYDNDSDEYTGPVINLKNEQPDPEENIIRKEKSEQLRDLVSKLKPRYQSLVQMRYFEELSHEEIAQKTGLPIGTIKAQLFRAREILFKQLKSK